MPTLIAELTDVLASLFGERGAIEHLCAAAGLNVLELDLVGPARNVWSKTLRYAEPRGKWPALVDAALREYPDHEPLRALRARL